MLGEEDVGAAPGRPQVVLTTGQTGRRHEQVDGTREPMAQAAVLHLTLT